MDRADVDKMYDPTWRSAYEIALDDGRANAVPEDDLVRYALTIANRLVPHPVTATETKPAERNDLIGSPPASPQLDAPVLHGSNDITARLEMAIAKLDKMATQHRRPETVVQLHMRQAVESKAILATIAAMPAPVPAGAGASLSPASDASTTFGPAFAIPAGDRAKAGWDRSIADVNREQVLSP